MHNRAEIYSACSDGLHPYPVRIQARKTPLVPDLQIDGLPAAITEHASCILTAAIRKLTATDAHAKVTIDRGTAPDTPPIAPNRLLAGLELPIALTVLSLHAHIDPTKLTRVLAAGRIEPFRGDATLCAPIDGASLTITRRRPPEPRPPEITGLPVNILRALEIAAAGHHHLNVIAPADQPTDTRPARILHAILPDLATPERPRTTHIHSLTGLLLPPYADQVHRPPLRAPHYTASTAAILGTRRQPG